MTDVTLQPIKREDYTPPPYWIDETHLTFDLDPVKTRVLNCMHIRPNPDAVNLQATPHPLRLDGTGLDLVRVLINKKGATFRIEETSRGTQLVLETVPQEPFELEIFTTCCPEKNTECQGLYVSQNAFFTQCEAESFRRITYFLDRPDVMATYTVTLRASKKDYPVLLSNGNLREQGDLENERHYAVWHDPFPKPCYLFGLVAGNLVCREQRINTASGNQHLLQVYVRAGDLDKTEHAMNSLINAIAWDENRYGLKLDLERYMVVAVSDFNMGAMENKGLNIFNTKYVLANPTTATDDDYHGIESVIGHEYFHNWTGNRVTCRDWFQLTLKEGLTVFRDQEFSMDMAGTPSARAIQRINDVRALRAAQFPEDASSMAHPIRPDEYMQIDNFYTATVYEKGAEVIRMMQTLVGRAGFSKGLNLYLERFDGKAVTCDDFAQAMVDANPQSALAGHHIQFMRWYSQSGTPQVSATGVYNAEQKTYTLTLAQSSAATATGEPSPNQPFVIPVVMGLICAQTGKALPLSIAANQQACIDASGNNCTLILTEEKQSWTFTDVTAEPIPSLLKDFSAPVRLQTQLDDAQTIQLLQSDTNPFNRWEAAQQLALSRLLHFTMQDLPVKLDDSFIQALRNILHDNTLDSGFKALLLTLPSEANIAEHLTTLDPQRIHSVREDLLNQLAQALRQDWIHAFETNCAGNDYSLTAKDAGMRTLANLALSHILRVTDAPDIDIWKGKTYQRFKDAKNMTNRIGALLALRTARSKLLAPALERFLKDFHHEALVVDKWFNLQATASDLDGDVLRHVRALLKHPEFSTQNPNRVRSLISAYCQGNPAAFHRPDGAGYTFWAEQVLLLNKTNPQIAARLARALDSWRKLAEPYHTLAHKALQKVAACTTLQPEVKEIITRTLAQTVNSTSQPNDQSVEPTAEPSADHLPDNHNQ